MLTGLRRRIKDFSEIPLLFLRDAISRVDRSMNDFFRRVKEKAKRPGFPRYKTPKRYISLEYIRIGFYICNKSIRIPKIGLVRARGQFDVQGKQRLLRIIRRPSGWYAQILIDTLKPIPPLVVPVSKAGIDLGINSFATLSNGEQIPNKRFEIRSHGELKKIQRAYSRCKLGGKNRAKGVAKYAGLHEKISARRLDFFHKEARKLVNCFDLIGFEKLNIQGMKKTGFGRSIMDVSWGKFIRILVCKAEYAGKHAIAVNSRGTSQECPDCGRIIRKLISERVHSCPCGCVLDRDVAAARVILARALRVLGACGGNGLYSAGNGETSRPNEAESLVLANTEIG